MIKKSSFIDENVGRSMKKTITKEYIDHYRQYSQYSQYSQHRQHRQHQTHKQTKKFETLISFLSMKKNLLNLFEDLIDLKKKKHMNLTDLITDHQMFDV